MPPPRFEPIVTLGNVISLISMVLAIAGVFYTNKAEVEELKRNMVEFRQEFSRVSQLTSGNTNRLTALEEWKAVGPRFTSNDAAALKAATLTEAANYTNTVAADMRNDSRELGKKIDALTNVVNDIRVMIAAQTGYPSKSSGGN